MADPDGGELLERVHRAIALAHDHLLSLQSQEGYWVGELEADSTLTSEWIMLMHWLDRVDEVRQKKASAWLLSNQLPDGGWPLFPGGPGHLSTTLKAYFALKLAGFGPDEPFMKRARELTLAQGGVARANVFTKIALAEFGLYPWSGVPAMPIQIMLLPRWFYFNINEVSYWSRTVIVPLLIIQDARPVCPAPPAAQLDDLWVRGKGDGVFFPTGPGWFTWRNFFVVLDRCLKATEGLWKPIGRNRARRLAEVWLLKRMGRGGLGGIYPAMANAVMALRLLGYPMDHPQVAEGLREIEGLVVEDGETLHVTPCLSAVWDTCLALNASIESDMPVDYPALDRATRWLLGKQIFTRGDWAEKRPNLEGGGWPFEFWNDFYPDLDDTAMALIGLAKMPHGDGDAVARAIRRGTAWFLGMQSRDGGWGSFDADNDHLLLNNIPFADHRALLDPSTEDLTGRGLELLGTLDYALDHPKATRALEFIKRIQHPDGPWWGRWGVNYIYGTWSVLRGLRAIGERMDAPYVRRAVRWLIAKQNADGGWGETLASYEDPSLAGTGASIPTQSAWALLGLLAAGQGRHRAVQRGVEYLLRTQQPDGRWEDLFWNGTGFPHIFYLKYHLYATYFPLWALGVYRREAHGVGHVSRTTVAEVARGE